MDRVAEAWATERAALIVHTTDLQTEIYRSRYPWVPPDRFLTIRWGYDADRVAGIRDRYAEILAGPERIPPKIGSHFGDPGNQEWFDLQRDEFDNAAALLAEIEAGGDKLVMKTDKAELEDPFILGPDLAGAVRKKMKIMRDHWRDVERWLAPPHM